MEKLKNANVSEVKEVEKIWNYDNNDSSVCVRHLGSWNNGQLIEEWISLPASEEEINAFYNYLILEASKVGVMGDGEFINSDWGNIPFKINEYTSLETINEQLEAIEHFSEDEIMVLETYLDNMYDDFDSAVEVVENGEYSIYDDCNDMSDVAWHVIEESGTLNGIPDTLARYFDYEAFGRDLEIEGNFFFIGDRTWIEFHQ